MASSTSSSAEWTPTERVHDIFLKYEQVKTGTSNVGLLVRSPRSYAVIHLADVPVCLAIIADLIRVAKGPDFQLR